MGWCDDPKSSKYNKLIKYPFSYGSERLYRSDNIYDIVIVLNFNMNPILKNRGSAIFIHVAKNNYSPTKGCIALKKIDLRRLLKIISKDTKGRVYYFLERKIALRSYIRCIISNSIRVIIRHSHT